MWFFRYLPRYLPSASITAAVLYSTPGCSCSYTGSTITIPSSLASAANRSIVGPGTDSAYS